MIGMDKILKYTLITLCASFLLSCKSSDKMENFSDKDLRFSMSKGVCFGSCPVYELKIYHGGYATLLGEKNIDRIGLYEKKITKDEFKKIAKAFSKLNFESYPTEFKSNIPDLPSISIGYHNGKTFKTVKGKEDRPEDLMQAQFLLEKIVDNKEWNFVKGMEEITSTKKPEPSFIYNEIIIEPKRGLLLPKWMDAHSEYGVRMIKKIAPALDYYLITFDTKKIDPQVFIAMLQKDRDILSAEFNKRTTQRQN